jgi:hypothetical protein
MKKHLHLLRTLALPATLLGLGSCADVVQPTAADARLSHSSAPTLVECPTDVTQSTSATIDLLGGTLELDGHKLVIPANAVLLPTDFTLTVPAGKYVKIDLKADGAEHFQFEKPVSMTISYARCTRANIDKIEKHNLDIFYVDGNNAILENFGGEQDTANKTVTTSTDHFSGYAIGGA